MQFVLKKPAKPDSLEVKVDGKIVDSGWVFVAGANAVRFDPSAAPAAGAVIDINYSTEK